MSIDCVIMTAFSNSFNIKLLLRPLTVSSEFFSRWCNCKTEVVVCINWLIRFEHNWEVAVNFFWFKRVWSNLNWIELTVCIFKITVLTWHILGIDFIIAATGDRDDSFVVAGNTSGTRRHCWLNWNGHIVCGDRGTIIASTRCLIRAGFVLSGGSGCREINYKK